MRARTAARAAPGSGPGPALDEPHAPRRARAAPCGGPGPALRHPRAAMTFTPLRVRSHGSLLSGVASPEALIGRALALGYESLALTDRDNLYLAIRFYRAARADGLRPL
ncbi:MAG: PHP domain-containing protein, partial [Candidatus Eisenbacteria bacterium]